MMMRMRRRREREDEDEDEYKVIYIAPVGIQISSQKYFKSIGGIIHYGLWWS